MTFFDFTCNIIYYQSTFIRADFILRLSSDQLVRDDKCARPSLIQTHLVITTIRQGLVRGKIIFTLRRLSQTLRIVLAHENTWFTVLVQQALNNKDRCNDVYNLA